MNIMTKRGSEDNIVTYEHYCDTKADLVNIPQDQISLGSVAIVLQDDNAGMGIYLANSNKEWISFSSGGGSSSDGDSSSGPVLEWTQLAEPEDVFTYDGNNTVSRTINVWANVNDMQPWALIKIVYKGNLWYSFMAPFITTSDNNTYISYLLAQPSDQITTTFKCTVTSTDETIDSIVISLNNMTSNDTSGISIYGALVTGWNE